MNLAALGRVWPASLRRPVEEGGRRLEEKLGGPARTKVILMLAAVLGLDTADKGATSALAAQLQAAFHIGTVDIGLLIAISSLVGAVFTLPMGVLADRASRTRVLVVAISIWALAEAASGVASGYIMLLLIRVALGVVTAAAGPTVASLTGDLFPARQRSRVYGFILTGELLGAGVGVVVAGDVGSAFGWRVGYAVLAIPSLVLAWAILRYFPEPARGGQSRLQEGAEEIPAAGDDGLSPPGAEGSGPEDGPEDDDVPQLEEDLVLQEVREQDVEPDPETILHGDPAKLRLWEAVRWVLKVRTNVFLIIASSLGYFFLAGVRAFAVIFFRGRYGVGESAASSTLLAIGVAAILGVLVVSRLADRWLRRGRTDARMVLGAAGYVIAAAVFIPALFSSSLAITLPILLVAAFFLASSNPPVDAARLDVVPSRMWGRAEGIRTFLRTLLEAFAPLLFGLVAAELGGGGSGASFGAGVNSKHVRVSPAEATGLDHTFLIMLLPLAAAGILLVLAKRRYLTDVASAGESEEQTAAAVHSGG